MSIAVSSYRYRTRRSDESLRVRLVELARMKPRCGYRRLQVLLKRDGVCVNHTIVPGVSRSRIVLETQEAKALRPQRIANCNFDRR
jgi:hypothetical protein